MKTLLLKAAWLLLFSLVGHVSFGQVDTVYKAVFYPDAVYAPGALLKGYYFLADTPIEEGWEFQPKESLKIFNEDTSFYPVSEVTLTHKIAKFDLALPRTLDTGYYDFYLKRNNYEVVCKSCLHVSLDIRPTISVYHEGIFTKRGSQCFAYLKGNNLSFVDSADTDCILQLKTRPQDVVLEYQSTQIAADSLQILPNISFEYPNHVNASFTIPLDAPSGEYVLKIKGDNQVCQIPIDPSTNRRHIYCDTAGITPVPTLEVPEAACLGKEVEVKLPLDSSITYTWKIEQGEIVSSHNNTAIVRSHSMRTTSTLIVSRAGACGMLSPIYESITFKIEPQNQILIAGPTEVCGNTSNLYSVRMYDYDATWKLLHSTGDIVVTGDSAEITFHSTPRQDTLVITYENACGVGKNQSVLPIRVQSTPTKPLISFQQKVLFDCTDPIYSYLPECGLIEITTFSKKAESYQWYKNGVAITNATDSVFRDTGNRNINFEGYYQLGVQTACGYALSDSLHVAYTLVVGLEVKERQQVEFGISPNPAYDNLQLKRSWTTESRALIYTSTGELVKQLEAVGNEIAITDLKNGLYILEMQTEGRASRKKFVVNR